MWINRRCIWRLSVPGKCRLGPDCPICYPNTTKVRISPQQITFDELEKVVQMSRYFTYQHLKKGQKFIQGCPYSTMLDKVTCFVTVSE